MIVIFSRSTDTDAEKVKDLLYEIENFDRLVDSLTKSLDDKELKVSEESSRNKF